MANQWFKFFGGEYLSDPKIERLNPLERSCWVTLLCLCSMNGDGKIEFLTVETLLNKSGCQFDPYHPEQWESAIGVLKKFQTLKMIRCNEDGTIEILNWHKRQETALTNAERQARYREKRTESNEKVTEGVTKVTLEENRIEEKRRDKKIKSAISENRGETDYQPIEADSSSNVMTRAEVATYERKHGSRYSTRKTEAPSAEVIAVLDLFAPLNPAYFSLRVMMPERDAVDRLLKIMNYEAIRDLVAFIVKNRAERYMPTITTPTALEKKMGDLAIYYQKQNNKAPAFI